MAEDQLIILFIKLFNFRFLIKLLQKQIMLKYLQQIRLNIIILIKKKD